MGWMRRAREQRRGTEHAQQLGGSSLLWTEMKTQGRGVQEKEHESRVTYLGTWLWHIDPGGGRAPLRGILRSYMFYSCLPCPKSPSCSNFCLHVSGSLLPSEGPSLGGTPPPSLLRSLESPRLWPLTARPSFTLFYFPGPSSLSFMPLPPAPPSPPQAKAGTRVSTGVAKRI